MNVALPYIIPPVLTIVTAYSLALIALIRGRLKYESILLALVCISWSLTAWTFIAHFVFTDEVLLMKIERSIHGFYVFMPAISVLFFQSVTGMKNRLIMLVFFAGAIALSFSVHTDYYFTGFNIYEWGRIARGGTAFSLYAASGVAGTLYIVYMFYEKMKVEKNSVIRTKLYYLFIAYFLSIVMIFTCIPSMYGYDFYHLANFVFIPISILTYGVLRYRLMEISSVLNSTVFWLLLSSLIIFPNMVMFIALKRYMASLSVYSLFIVFLLWFILNYLYFIRIQPFIDRLFNRLSFNLGSIHSSFDRDLSLLKTFDDLAFELSLTLKRAFSFENAQLFCRRGYMNVYTDSSGNSIEINSSAQAYLANQEYIEKSLIESATGSDVEKDFFMPLFDVTGSEYIIPLYNRDELIAVLALSRRNDGRRISEREFRFIKKINSYASIAIANSVIYQDLSDMKDNLEKIVAERTSIIESQKAEMERDIELARQIQIALLPGQIPDLAQVDIAFRYEPVMRVGGDFIDIHYREGMNDLGLFICDVSGHGAASAMISSMVKMSLNSWGRFMRSPGQAFIEMRNMLYGKMGENFITACMCCIDLESGVVVSANAGHPPLIIARSDGRLDVISSEGKIIVDYTASEYEENTSRLEKGDKLILYTDGVIEVRNTDWESGEKRFHDIIRRNINLSADGLCKMIFDEIALKDGVPAIDDDFAVLVAEYRGN